MPYLIFLQYPDGSIWKIGETLYLPDAEAILKNWHSGFINRSDGETIIVKNLIKKENES